MRWTRDSVGVTAQAQIVYITICFQSGHTGKKGTTVHAPRSTLSYAAYSAVRRALDL